MTSQDMTHDTGPGEDDEVVVAELVEDAGALEPRVPVVGVDPDYVDLYRRLRAEGGVDLREQLHDRYLQLARGGVTAGGLPWPSPTDPVAEGADAIRALAEAVDAKVSDTGWVDIDLASGVSQVSFAERPAVCAIGGIVLVRGGILTTGFTVGAAARLAGTVPMGFRPKIMTTGFLGVPYSGSRSMAYFYITNAGQWYVTTPGSGNLPEYWFFGGAPWSRG